jgi:hypothetical protein
MYYHCVATLGEGRYHRWWNLRKEKCITHLIIPLLKGQVIEGKCRKKSSLVNMKAIDHFTIFRTRKKLSSARVEQFKKRNRVGTVCTHELLREIGSDKAIEQTKSLWQRLILPPKHQIFVIMKFGDEELDSAYDDVIRPLGEEFGYTVLRIDEVQNSGKINDQILDSIAESELICADLTGARPNCYFEIGVALTLGKEMILSIKMEEEPHFDLSVNRFIKWKTKGSFRRQLRQRLESIVSGETS